MTIHRKICLNFHSLLLLFISYPFFFLSFCSSSLLLLFVARPCLPPPPDDSSIQPTFFFLAFCIFICSISICVFIRICTLLWPDWQQEDSQPLCRHCLSAELCCADAVPLCFVSLQSILPVSFPLLVLSILSLLILVLIFSKSFWTSSLFALPGLLSAACPRVHILLVWDVDESCTPGKNN